jgi:hypothetical protein
MAGDVHIDLVGNLDELVAKLPELESSSHDAALAIAAAARALAPVDQGNYIDGIVTQKTPSGTRVVATDQKSAWIEFGVPSRGIPARFILRRAVEAVGLKFKKRG